MRRLAYVLIIAFALPAHATLSICTHVAGSAATDGDYLLKVLWDRPNEWTLKLVLADYLDTRYGEGTPEANLAKRLRLEFRLQQIESDAKLPRLDEWKQILEQIDSIGELPTWWRKVQLGEGSPAPARDHLHPFRTEPDLFPHGLDPSVVVGHQALRPVDGGVPDRIQLSYSDFPAGPNTQAWLRLAVTLVLRGRSLLHLESMTPEQVPNLERLVLQDSLDWNTNPQHVLSHPVVRKVKHLSLTDVRDLEILPTGDKPNLSQLERFSFHSAGAIYSNLAVMLGHLSHARTPRLRRLDLRNISTEELEAALQAKVLKQIRELTITETAISVPRAALLANAKNLRGLEVLKLGGYWYSENAKVLAESKDLASLHTLIIDDRGGATGAIIAGDGLPKLKNLYITATVNSKHDILKAITHPNVERLENLWIQGIKPTDNDRILLLRLKKTYPKLNILLSWREKDSMKYFSP